MAVVDVTPLRQVPGYRWLFAGMFLTQAGRQLTVVAVPLQLFELTGSTLMLGLLGLAQVIPLILVSLVGGALADAVDRRKVLVISQLVLSGTAAGLLWNSLSTSPAVWPLFVMVALNAGASAIEQPSRHALIPGLVGTRLLPSALALNQTLVNTAKAAFPAIGGLLIATAGFAFSFGTELVLFLGAALVISRIPDVPLEGERRRMELSSITEGFRFLGNRRVIQAALLLDLNAMVFGMPSALFPEMGLETFGGDAVTVGLLYAAPGIGAMIAALTSGWVGRVARLGRATVIAVMVWGIAIALFGLTTSLRLALVLLAFAGAADVVSAIFRGTIVQLSSPDEIRGRMSSMHTAVSAGGPRLGDLEAGVVAELTSTRFSVVSGGVACVIGAWVIAKWAPEFLRYRFNPNKPQGWEAGLPAET